MVNTPPPKHTKLVFLILLLIVFFGILLGCIFGILTLGLHIEFLQQPTNAVSMQNVTPAVSIAVKDQSGNVIQGDNTTVVNISLANPRGAILFGTLYKRAIKGIATFNDLHIDKANTGYILQAFITTSLTFIKNPVTSQPFNITTGGASQLAFTTSPSLNQTINTAFSPAPVIQVQDAGGNLVTTDNNPVTIAIGFNANTAFLSGSPLTINANGGIANFTASALSLDSVGFGYTMIATRIGLTTGTSLAFNETGGIPFISQWNTANVSTGSSANNQITLPLPPPGVNGATYDFIVDWGDTPDTQTIITNNNYNTANTHTYTNGIGTYTVTITGVCTGWEFINMGDRLKLLNITQWGTFKLGNTGAYFNGCANLTAMTPSDVINLSGTTNLTDAFNGCTNLISVQHLPSWNMNGITSIQGMFINASSFNQNISSWDTSNVTTMYATFTGAASFNQDLITSGNIWNVSNVTTFALIFGSATAFNGHLTGWNTINAITMSSMFYLCPNFNRDISFFNTASVTDMSSMFTGASVFNQNIGGWNVSNVTNMTSMFQQASVFNQDLSSWNVSQVTSMFLMFWIASAYNNNSVALTNWNTSSVTNMFAMFAAATTFNQNIGSWNTSAVTTMASMFQSATSFNQNIGLWNTAKVTAFNNMFLSASIFNQNIVLWNTIAVTTMANMFQNATAFNQNIGLWNTSAVKTMASMFQSATTFNQNISSWDTHSVTTMASMFQSASAFDQNMPNLGGIGTGTQWDVSKVISMNSMFANATAFGTVNGNIDNWNTILVADMRSMFSSASNFNQNLAAWNVTGLTSVLGASTMFTNATAYNTPSPNPNYSNLLIGWAAQAVQTGVTFGAGTAKYSITSAGAAKATLTNINGDNWTITDGGGIGPATQLGFIVEPSSTSTGGVAFATQPKIAVQDSNGHTITNYAGANLVISIFSGPGGTLLGTTSVAPVSGVATYSGLSINLASATPYVLTATNGTIVTTVNSTNITISVGTATQLGFIVEPSSVGTGGVAFTTQPHIAVQDAGGNTVTTYSGANLVISIASGPGGTLSGTQSIAPVSGVATYSGLSINLASATPYILTATNGSLITTVNSTNITISVGTATKLSFNTSPSVNNTVSTVFSTQPIIYVEDAGGNLVTTDTGLVTISIGTNVNTASLGGSPLFMNAVGGIANFSASGLYLDSAGFNYTLSATRAGLSTATSATFNETGNSFTSTWTTTVPSTTITLPLVVSGIYDFIVNWGDGSGTAHITTNSASHLFASAGTYTITISSGSSPLSAGVITGWEFNNSGSILLLTNITQWGTFKLGNTGFYFYGCSNLTAVTPSDVLILSGTTTLLDAFRGCSSLTSITNLNSWNISNVTNLSSMFQSATVFNQNISLWDTHNVTNMTSMFQSAAAFDQNIPNVNGTGLGSQWDVSQVTNCSSMFTGATAFGTTNGNISNWNVSNVTNMSSMFQQATNFNKDISTWNVSKVTSMFLMFWVASAYNNNSVALSSWNTSAVTNMQAMFESATAFNQNIGSWNTSAVTTMVSMFQGATAFNQNIGSWNTAKVTTFASMFSGATNFNQNIGSWNITGVTTIAGLAAMFANNTGGWNATVAPNNYSLLLEGWSAQIPSVISGVTFTASTGTGSPVHYGSGAPTTARNLLSGIGWTFVGDTQ